jgi:Flp pilus assembly protein TadD
MNYIFLTFGAGLLCAATLAGAAGGESPSPSAGTAPGWSAAGKAETPAVASAKAAIATGDYAGAQRTLQAALAGEPGNADLHNLYAYSVRKGANPDMQLVFTHYNEALRIDPKHRGAHEYIGEAFLMVNNPAKAKEHLAALNKICFFGCEEYEMLKKAIAAYEAKAKQ